MTDRTAASASPSGAPLPWFLRLAVIAVVPPLALFAYLVANPHVNHTLALPIPHFFIVTNIALLAAGVAFLVARAALRMEQYRVVFIALGFMSLAGLFAVHAFSTPGVLPAAPGADADYSADYGVAVVILSAYLSLFVPAVLFGASYTRAGMKALQRFALAGRMLVLIVAGLVAGYAALAVLRPVVLSYVPLSHPPYPYALAAISVALFVLAAWHQTRTYARTRFPVQGALAVAFLFLAQAQIIMVVAAFWTLAWWEYHLLMFLAVLLALGALFVELDRRRGLERFLPSEVVERVVAGDLIRLAGERRVVTVLFADLRGSTALAERLAAGDVVKILNDYVGVLARCVFAHGGMLDKFLGDGLMAIFGVVPDATDGAAPAARAALEMRRAVASLNGARTARGEAAIGFGVGMHAGEVVLGAIGIPQRSDFTAIGDTVNTAARLQDLSKEFGVDLVISEQTAARLPAGEFAPAALGTAPVRGKAQPVQVLTLR